MIPGDSTPENLGEYQKRMYAEAKRLRERTPESTVGTRRANPGPESVRQSVRRFVSSRGAGI